jgi:hypothetical protein
MLYYIPSYRRIRSGIGIKNSSESANKTSPPSPSPSARRPSPNPTLPCPPVCLYLTLTAARERAANPAAAGLVGGLVLLNCAGGMNSKLLLRSEGFSPVAKALAVSQCLFL